MRQAAHSIHSSHELWNNSGLKWHRTDYLTQQVDWNDAIYEAGLILAR